MQVVHQRLSLHSASIHGQVAIGKVQKEKNEPHKNVSQGNQNQKAIPIMRVRARLTSAKFSLR